jgi:hypothetical protein
LGKHSTGQADDRGQTSDDRRQMTDNGYLNLLSLQFFQSRDINVLKIKKEFGKMNKMIKADIYFDGEYYCGKCIDFDIFTQGETLTN